MSLSSTQAVLTLVFGMTATLTSVVAVWQGYKFWKTWYGHTEAESSRNDHTTGMYSCPGQVPLDLNHYGVLFTDSMD